jgi:agmatine deiminase
MNRRRLLRASAALLTGTWGAKAMANKDVQLWVPPEENRHQRTFMQWPVNRDVYQDAYFLRLVQQTIADIANTISEFEPVTLLADRQYHQQIRKSVGTDVELWDVHTDDLWCRDSGPLFAKTPQGELVISHLQFNGWGNRQAHRLDGSIATRLSTLLSLPMVASELIGEAGGVDHDGHGLMIAHESSWVNDNRNPGLSRDQIEQRLLYAYGASRIIWSPGVWGEEITDYHIDSLARFTGPANVLINLPKKPDPNDPFHIAAVETYNALLAADLQVDVIDEPEYRRVQHEDFVASYANYYVCNGAVIAAQFGDSKTDARAKAALKTHYPGREVIMLNVDALGEIGGGIHCATQQMPA